MANQQHEKVFDFCESNRAPHPGFLYWLLESNRDNSLEKGIWFQGKENYGLVGLI